MCNKIDVIILCGGLNSRMLFFGKNKPKNLLKINKKTILERQIEMISCLPINRIILATYFLSEKIEKICSENEFIYKNIIIAKSDKELGTAGSINDVVNRFSPMTDRVLVLNGDILCSASISEFYKFFSHKMSCLMMTKKLKRSKNFGSLNIDSTGKVLSFIEKNKKSKNCLINAGIYIFSNEFIRKMRERKVFSLEYEVFPEINDLFSYEIDDIWHDVGTPLRYLKAYFQYFAFETIKYIKISSTQDVEISSIQENIGEPESVTNSDRLVCPIAMEGCQG